MRTPPAITRTRTLGAAAALLAAAALAACAGADPNQSSGAEGFAGGQDQGSSAYWGLPPLERPGSILDQRSTG